MAAKRPWHIQLAYACKHKAKQLWGSCIFGDQQDLSPTGPRSTNNAKRSVLLFGRLICSQGCLRDRYQCSISASYPPFGFQLPTDCSRHPMPCLRVNLLSIRSTVVHNLQLATLLQDSLSPYIPVQTSIMPTFRMPECSSATSFLQLMNETCTSSRHHCYRVSQ